MTTTQNDGTNVNNYAGLSIDLKLPAFPAIDDKKYPDIFSALVRITNGIRTLQSVLDQYIQPIVAATCSEDIALGAMVNFFPSGDVIQAQNAYAVDHTKPCHAFAAGAYTAGTEGQFQTCGANPFIPDLVPGTVYYLGDGATPGNITDTQPSVAGHLVQVVGVAISATQLLFFPSQLYKEL